MPASAPVRAQKSCRPPEIRRAGQIALAFLLAIFVLAARPAAADPALLDLSIDDLLQVEVSTASKFAQPQSHAPSAVSVITAADIRAQGYRSITEALLALPGTYAIDDHTYSFLGARGFLVPGDFNTRFLLLVDGVRINDNIYEQAFFGHEFPLDIDLVERIEYVPGPGSSIYGANAMFGVINVITRSAESLAGARAALRLGSDGERRSRFSWGGADPDGNSLLVAGSVGGWPGRDRSYPDAASLGLSPDGVAHGLDRSRLGSFYWRAKVQGWTFQGMWRDREVRPSSAPYASLFDDGRLRVRDQGFYAALSKESEIAAGLSLFGQLQLGEMRYRGDYPLDDGAGGSYLNADRVLGRWWNGELRLDVSRFSGHRLLAGLELQHDLVARQENFDVPLQAGSNGVLVDRLRRRWGVYLQDEWRLSETFILNLGLRHDRFSLPQRSTSPRLAAIWLPRPATTLKLLAGRAFRPANAYERDYSNNLNYLANPGLRPESIRTNELVWEQRLSSRSSFSASLFRYRLDNLIAQTADAAGVLMFQNLPAISARGAELAAEHRFAGGARLRASFAGQKVGHADGSHVTNSPSRVGKLQATIPLAGERWSLGWETQVVGPRRWTWAGMEQRVGSQVLAHATLTCNCAGSGLDLSFSLRNLFNRRLSDPAAEDSSVPRVPQDGRTLVIKAAYAF